MYNVMLAALSDPNRTPLIPVLRESISSQKYTFFSELEKLTRPATRNNIMVLPALTQHRDRPPDPTFRKSRNFGIARRTEGVGRGTPQWRQGTPRRMHGDNSGSRGMRESEENRFGIRKNSLEYQNRMNSKTKKLEVCTFFVKFGF